MLVRSVSWLPLALAFGCDVRQDAPPLDGQVPFACASNSDCPSGSCLAEAGICTRASGRLRTLLFEITPQPSDPIYGGAQFLAFQDVSQPPRAGSPLTLNVRPRVPVTGRVLAAPEQSACLSLGRTTLPATLTFTPREQLLGLSLPSYELSTVFDPLPEVREWVFQGALPPGRYDVYMRPNLSQLGSDIGEECRAIPQIFRDRLVGTVDDAVRLELQQPLPAVLRLDIAWADTLENWSLDMVHPVTGEVLSNRVTLHESDVDPATNTLVTTLNYSSADNDFIDPDGGELVRLTPPPGVPAGTVLLVRSGLELVMPGQGAIGDVSSFGAPVAFQAWVWKRGLEDAPVPGSVSFAAVELDEAATGVRASFETQATVDPTGQVNVQLLPGRYRVRVTPPGLEIAELGLLTSYESTVTVWPNGDPALDRQGGHVIGVPPAMSLSGRIVAEANDMALRQVEVRATAANPYRDLCPDPTPELPEPMCARPQPPVLQRAWAQDPFVPRTRSGRTLADGAFRIDGLDCGPCDPEAVTRFDLTVRPDSSTGLPWLILPGIDLYADAASIRDVPLRVPMPVARPMRITYGEPGARPEGGAADAGAPNEVGLQGLPGALVRVFAVLDARGQLVANPEGLAPCWAASDLNRTPCLQSLLQVAEARTGEDGELLLLLPPDVD